MSGSQPQNRKECVQRPGNLSCCWGSWSGTIRTCDGRWFGDMFVRGCGGVLQNRQRPRQLGPRPQNQIRKLGPPPSGFRGPGSRNPAAGSPEPRRGCEASRPVGSFWCQSGGLSPNLERPCIWSSLSPASALGCKV